MTYTDIYGDVYGGGIVDIPDVDTGSTFPAMLPPDVLAIAIGYLNLYIDPTFARAHSRVPNPRPDERDDVPHRAFIVAEYSGGGRDDELFMIVRPNITFDSYAKREDDAIALANLARAYLYTMRGTVQNGITFYGIHEFAGIGPSPDPVSELPRYRWTAQFVARCIEIPLVAIS